VQVRRRQGAGQAVGRYPDLQWQDVAVPPATSLVSRRQILAGMGRGMAAVALLPAAAACGSPPPPKVDELTAELTSAHTDSELARAAALAAPPPLAPALTQVASERSEHARALAEEIARAAGLPAPSASQTSTAESTTTTTTSAAATPPPTAQDVSNALRGSAASAGELAAKVSGYRAGLLASIAASCTASVTIGLVIPKAPA
jgi:hypothetical protein